MALVRLPVLAGAALCLATLCSAAPCHGQDPGASAAALACGDAAARYGGSARSDTTGATYLSTFEREMLAALNAARTRPSAFARHLVDLRRRFDGRLLQRPGKPNLRTQEGAAAVTEAIQALRSTAPLDALVPSAGLSRAAHDHVCDTGPAGHTGHTGLDGSSMTDRVERYGSWRRAVAENIAYGTHSPREMVVQLIVDDGVPSRGHRENIFNASFQRVGLACGPHAQYQRMCVMDFAGGYAEASSAAPAGSNR